MAEHRLVLSFLPGFFQNFYNAQAGQNTFNDEQLHKSWATAIEDSPTGTLECVSAWLEDFREDLAKIDVPTLVLHGNSDKILPIAATGNRVAEYVKGSKLVIIDGAPHGMTWTHADQVNPPPNRIFEFLKHSTIQNVDGEFAAKRDHR